MRQGAKQTDAAARRLQREADRRHGCEPVDSATTDQPLQRSLRLILPLMAEQQVEHAGSAAPAGEQREARGPSLLLNCRERVRAVPPERSVGNGAAGEPAPHLSGFGCRFGAQPMVDGERVSRSPRARAQRSASRQSARLSGPPETATAIRGAGSKGPSGAMSASKAVASMVAAAGSGLSGVTMRGVATGGSTPAAIRDSSLGAVPAGPLGEY